MARIAPVDESSAPPGLAGAGRRPRGHRQPHDEHEVDARPLAGRARRAADVVSAARQVAPVLGERRTWLFCHAISTASDCLICSTFFRRLLIDAGEDPARWQLDEFDELIVDFGRRLGDGPALRRRRAARAAGRAPRHRRRS